MDKLLNHPWLILLLALGVSLCIGGYRIRIKHDAAAGKTQKSDPA